jgi:amino acid transporter
MIALGGAVGTGLIIGSGTEHFVLSGWYFYLNHSIGTALRRGGPLGILIGYSYVGEFMEALTRQ